MTDFHMILLTDQTTLHIYSIFLPHTSLNYESLPNYLKYIFQYLLKYNLRFQYSSTPSAHSKVSER